MTNSMPYDQCITLVRSVMFANVQYKKRRASDKHFHLCLYLADLVNNHRPLGLAKTPYVFYTLLATFLIYSNFKFKKQTREVVIKAIDVFIF